MAHRAGGRFVIHFYLPQLFVKYRSKNDADNYGVGGLKYKKK